MNRSMCRILPVVIFFFISTNICAQNYYVSPSGSNSNNGTSVMTPWLTLSYATAHVTTGTINVGAGTYNEPNQCTVNVGVNISGVDSNTTFINLGYYNASENSAAIMLVSASQGTSGNQNISNIAFGVFDSCFSGILVKARGGVHIFNCSFHNFLAFAVRFASGQTTGGGIPPTSYAVGNQFYNNSTTDCSIRNEGGNLGGGIGAICLDGQQTMLINNNTFSQVGRPQGQNGDCMGVVNGFCKDMTVSNNQFFKPVTEGNVFNCAIENWYDQGGWNVFDNTFNGGGTSIDIAYGGGNKGSYSYSFFIHKNTFQAASQIPTYDGADPNWAPSVGTSFETENTANAGYATIDSNTYINTATAFQITMTHGTVEGISNVTFRNNVGWNMGYADGSFGSFMTAIYEQAAASRLDSIFIYNNTLNSGTTGYARAGVFIQNLTTTPITNTFIQNNIITNCKAYGYVTYDGSGTISNVYLENNNPFNNSFTNNPYTRLNDGTPTVSYAANSGNITTNPLFVNAAANNYNLQSTSPCVSGGLNPPNTYIGALPPSGATVPTITWTPTTPITYGTALGAAQLNATSGGVSGSFVYTPGAGTILNAGANQMLRLTFTPSNLAMYSIVNDSVLITVNQASASLSASNTTQQYTGSPLQPTITTSPAGLTVINTTYNGIGTIPTNAASYAAISGLANANYTATPISYTFTISQATAVISISNTTQTYTGSPLSVLVSTNPNVSGIAVTYNGSSAPPTSAGTYQAIAKLTNANYTATPDTVTFTILAATPTVSWNTPAPITFGTALSATQLDATASVAGTFTYSPVSGTVLNAGTYTLSVNFTPTDATDYNAVNNTTVTLVVNKATASISLSNLNQLYTGLPLPVTVSTTPAGLTVITVTYNGSTTVPSAIGSYPVVAYLTNSNYNAPNATGTLVISNNASSIAVTNLSQTYTGTPLPVTVQTIPNGLTYSLTYNGSATTPTTAGSYTVIATITQAGFSGADTVTYTINKATPIIIWGTPAAITYGTALSGTQLNASSTTAGTFAYNPAAGTILNAGANQLLSVGFTPSDATDYNTTSATVYILVNPASATISLGNLNQVYDSTPKAVTILTNPAGLSGITVTYSGSDTVAINAGSYPIVVTLSNPNYTAPTVTGTLVISKANAILSYSQPLPLVFGTPLSSTQLDATSNKTGTFTYNYAIGTVLSVGTHTLQATFHPTNPNYNSNTVSTTITIYGSAFILYYVTPGKTIYLNRPPN